MNANLRDLRLVSRPVLIGALVVGVACPCAWLLLHRGPDPDTTAELASPPVTSQSHAAPASRENASLTTNDAGARTAARVEPAPAVRQSAIATPAPLPEPTPFSRQ